MRKQDTISRKRMAQILKEEIAAFQLEEQLLREYETAIKERKDIQSMIAEEFIKRYYGSHIDIHRIDEGVWDKIKGGLAKMGQISNLVPGQRAKKAKSAEDLAAALEAAGDNMFQKALQTLKKVGFPNNESTEQFRLNVNSINQMYAMVIESVKEGQIPLETGVKTIELLQQYVTDAATQLKSVYGVTNEELEAEKLAEAEEAELDALEEAFREEDTALTEELVQEINLNRIDKLVDAGRISPMDGVKRIEKAMRGPAGKGLKKIFRNRTKRAMRDQIIRKAVETSGEEAVKKVAPKIVKTIPKTVMKKFATKSMGIVTTSPKTAGPIVSTIKSAPSLGGLMAYLGVTPAVAAVGAAALLGGALFYKNRKSSRAAQLRDLGKRLVVPPDLEASAIDSEDLITKDPEEIEQQQSSLEAEKDEERGPEPDADTSWTPGDPGPPGDPITEPGEPAGEDIYVFRGKGGKGIQSQLAKVGIKGPAMSALLKGLRADLSAGGFNVLEEAIFGSVLAEISKEKLAKMQAARAAQKAPQADPVPQPKGEETVKMQPGAGDRKDLALDNTIAALEQMQDPQQKEAARDIISTVLSNYGSLPPGFTTAAAPAPAAEPAAAEPAAAEPAAEPAAAEPAAEPAAAEPAAGEEETGEMSDAELMQNLKKSKKKKGWTGNVGSIMEKEEKQIQETLDRWHTIAGIIKG